MRDVPHVQYLNTGTEALEYIFKYCVDMPSNMDVVIRIRSPRDHIVFEAARTGGQWVRRR